MIIYSTSVDYDINEPDFYSDVVINPNDDDDDDDSTTDDKPESGFDDVVNTYPTFDISDFIYRGR